VEVAGQLKRTTSSISAITKGGSNRIDGYPAEPLEGRTEKKRARTTKEQKKKKKKKKKKKRRSCQKNRQKKLKKHHQRLVRGRRARKQQMLSKLSKTEQARKARFSCLHSKKDIDDLGLSRRGQKCKCKQKQTQNHRPFSHKKVGFFFFLLLISVYFANGLCFS
jgi:hypothetical protein